MVVEASDYPPTTELGAAMAMPICYGMLPELGCTGLGEATGEVGTSLDILAFVEPIVKIPRVSHCTEKSHSKLRSDVCYDTNDVTKVPSDPCPYKVKVPIEDELAAALKKGPP